MLDEASRLLATGNAHFEQTEFDEARECWVRARDLFNEAGDRRHAGVCIGNLGTLFDIRGDVKQALAHYEEALAIAQELANPQGEADALGNIAFLYTNRGQLGRAESYHQRALTIERQIGHREGEIATRNNLGLIRLARGKLREAAVDFEETLRIAREITHARGEATALGNLGVVYRRRGDFKRARSHLDQAVDAHRRVGYRLGEADAHFNLGELERELGDLEAAGRSYEASVELVEMMRGSLLQEDHRLAFLGVDRLQAHRRLISLYYACGRTADALHVAEKTRSRVLMEQLSVGRMAAPTDAPSELLNQEQMLLAAVSEAIAAVNAARIGERAERVAHWHQLQADLNAVWNTLAEHAPSYVAVRLGQPATFGDIRECLVA